MPGLLNFVVVSSVLLLIVLAPGIFGGRNNGLGHYNKNVAKGHRQRNPVGQVGDGRSGFKERPAGVAGYKRWSQTYENIPVYGAELITQVDANDEIISIYGEVIDTFSQINTTPAINKSRAVQTLSIYWNHTGSTYELRNVNATLNILVNDEESNQGETTQAGQVLTWFVSYHTDRPSPTWIQGHVNAHSGEIEYTWNNIKHLDIPAVLGNNKIGRSTETISVQSVTTEICEHIDNTRKITVYNCGETSTCTQTQFTCSQANLDNWDLYSKTGGFSPRNEAFLYTVNFVDMWSSLVGTSALCGPLNRWKLYVHYGSRYENAYFDGNGFYFGDGKDYFYPLTTIDVVCHEIGHAITAYCGGNMEYTRESGGMNEAYSDIIGETCDMYYKSKTNYRIGDDCRRATNSALRDMCNPTIYGDRDSYKSFRKNDNVHTSSGIYNKAWCTLAKTAGWDYQKAFKVFTRANLLKWTTKVSMRCGVCGVEAAAEELGYNKTHVTAAFTAVDLTCSCGGGGGGGGNKPNKPNKP